MNKLKYKHNKIIYVDGYDHYDKERNIQVLFRVNAAEKAFLDDLLSVLEVKNASAFIRNQVFHAYQSLTDQQRQQMAEVAHWRHEEDNKTAPLR